ncbi:MAG TPA: hypothetical protein PKY82_22950 [Pyrinomonadaceae bacterium]|nr:hypothetical protein [Pyrinomonadaceae bacterium]
MESENIQSKKIGSKLISCPNCFALNDDLTEFCHQCNSRVIESNLTPLGAAYSQGDMLGKALETRPKLIVLIMTWVFALPIFLISAAMVVNQIFNGGGTNGLFAFWFGIISCIVSGKFLYTITKNYFTIKKKVFENDGELLD